MRVSGITKLFFTLGLVAAMSVLSFGQGSSNSGALAAQSTDCSVTSSCVVLRLSQDTASATVQVTGTFSATVTFEVTSNGTTWVGISGTVPSTGSGNTTITSSGIWQFSTGGLAAIRMRCSTYSSGTVGIYLLSGSGPPFASASVSISGGNAAASATGSNPPANADFQGVTDISSGHLTGVTGTAVGGNEAMNVNILNATSPLPTGAATSANQTNAAQKTQVVDGSGNVIGATSNALDVNIKSGGATGVAQGSTTSGQLITPIACGTTTSPPSYTTAQTNIVSCDTAGDLRVVVLNTPTVTVGSITNVTGTTGGGLPSAAIQVMFSNSGGTASQVLKLDASGNVPVSGSLTTTPNATFGSAAPSTGFMMGFRNGSNADYAVTNASHQPQMEIAAITAAASGPQTNSGSDSVVISPYQLSWTDASIALTTGGTSQTLIATNSSRHAFCVQNPLSAAEQGIGTAENININFTSAASDTGGHSITLAPGASYCEAGGQVTTEAITANAATTAHIIIAKQR